MRSDAYMRDQMDEDELKKVIKLYPHTRQADLAAFDLIDNKLCGDWQGSEKCPEKEAEYLREVRGRVSRRPAHRAGALSGGLSPGGAQWTCMPPTAATKRATKRTSARPRAGGKVERQVSPVGLRVAGRLRWCTNWIRAFLSTASTAVKRCCSEPRIGRIGLRLRPGGFLNAYIQSVLLGIVEGLTEFLPVSSTAHLRITEALMKIPLDDAYWKMYTIVIQLGAILALLLLFLGRIVGFLRTFPQGRKRQPHLAEPSHLAHADCLCLLLPFRRCCCTSGARSTWAACRYCLGAC